MKKQGLVYDIAVTAVFTAVIVVCSWVTVPIGPIPFTLQVFGILCTVGVLGLKRGFNSVLLYILLGSLGLPVFHGFQGGLGVLFGATGGFVFGFLFTAIWVGLFRKYFESSIIRSIIFMSVGVILCYAVGILWYVFVFSGGKGFGSALLTTVVPFVLPDIIKVLAAAVVIKRVSKYVK